MRRTEREGHYHVLTAIEAYYERAVCVYKYLEYWEKGDDSSCIPESLWNLWI